jgi:hypothetical protein
MVRFTVPHINAMIILIRTFPDTAGDRSEIIHDCLGPDGVQSFVGERDIDGHQTGHHAVPEPQVLPVGPLRSMTTSRNTLPRRRYRKQFPCTSATAPTQSVTARATSEPLIRPTRSLRHAHSRTPRIGAGPQWNRHRSAGDQPYVKPPTSPRCRTLRLQSGVQPPAFKRVPDPGLPRARVRTRWGGP